MSSKNVRGNPANRETLLYLAWLAGQTNIESLKTLRARGRRLQRILLAQLLYSLPPVFELDNYGPIYQALFLHRVGQIEWTSLHWAIRGSGAVYLAKGTTSRKNSPKVTEETDILWGAANQQEQARYALRSMKKRWQQEPNELVSQLRIHFEKRMPLLMRSVESAFLVQEFLKMSLERVNWRKIAALLLEIPLEEMPPARQPEEENSSWPQLQLALLQESLWFAERTFGDFGSDQWLSQEASQLCLGLADQCLDVRRNLADLQEEGKIYAPDHWFSGEKKAPTC